MTTNRVEEIVDKMRYTSWQPVGGLSNAKWYSRYDVMRALTSYANEIRAERDREIVEWAKEKTSPYPLERDTQPTHEDVCGNTGYRKAMSDLITTLTTPNTTEV